MAYATNGVSPGWHRQVLSPCRAQSRSEPFGNVCDQPEPYSRVEMKRIEEKICKDTNAERIKSFADGFPRPLYIIAGVLFALLSPAAISFQIYAILTNDLTVVVFSGFISGISSFVCSVFSVVFFFRRTRCTLFCIYTCYIFTVVIASAGAGSSFYTTKQYATEKLNLNGVPMVSFSWNAYVVMAISVAIAVLAMTLLLVSGFFSRKHGNQINRVVPDDLPPKYDELYYERGLD